MFCVLRTHPVQAVLYVRRPPPGVGPWGEALGDGAGATVGRLVQPRVAVYGHPLAGELLHVRWPGVPLQLLVQALDAHGVP